MTAARSEERDNYYRIEDAPTGSQASFGDFQSQVLSIESALVSATPATAQALLGKGQIVLTELWNAALERDDQGAMTAVSASWDNMNALKLQADTGIATAHAAVAGMKKAVEQRDQVAGELEELTEAMLNSDPDHPLVAELLEEHQNELFEMGLHVQCPGCAMCEQGYPVDHDAVNYFVSTILFDACDLSPMLLEECADFIHQWTQKAQAEEAASGRFNLAPDNLDEFAELDAS